MMSKNDFWLIVIFIACLSVVFLVQHTADYENNVEGKAEYDMFYTPHPDYARMLSCGFKGAAADIYWIKTVIYFGRRVMKKDLEYMGYELYSDKRDDPGYLQWKKNTAFRYRYLYDLLNTVTELDPYFHLPYTFGGLFLTLKYGRPDLSVELLKKGREFIKDSWHIPYYLGFNYYFYLNDPLKAAEYYMEAARFEDAPKEVISLARGILMNEGKRNMAIEFITGVKESTDNPDTKKEMEKLLEQMKTVVIPADTSRISESEEKLSRSEFK
ncbi:hypothetical protein ACFL67_03795 [candidate division KSB1 bacterium]